MGVGNAYASRRWVVGLLTLAVFCCAASTHSSKAHAARYWGGTIKGDVYGETGEAGSSPSVLAHFERDAGKPVTMVNSGQSWLSFDTTRMQAIADAGAIPLVTMGLSSGVTLADVTAGKQDTQIRTWAEKAKQWGLPFLFRPWWEPNGNWYAWGRSPDYVAAWRHFHDVVEEVGATNVTWAWVVNTIWAEPASDPTPYYPGDPYVDWVGMDAYNWGRNPLQPDRWLTPEQTIGPTLDVLRTVAPGKPVCICEEGSTEIGGNKASWVREMLGSYLPHHPEIEAYLWFNWNVQDGPGRWDWPIESSTASEQAFRDSVQSAEFLSELPPLPLLSKVPEPKQPTVPIIDGSNQGPTTVPDGKWSQPSKAAPGGFDARQIVSAVSESGRTTIAWVNGTENGFEVCARQFEPDGVPVGPVLTMSDPTGDALEPAVAIAPSGAATVVWKFWDGVDNVIQTRRILADGSLESSTHDLSVGGADRNASQPTVATAYDGRSFVAWQRYNSFRTIIQERQVYVSGTPAGTTYNLSNNQQNSTQPQVVTAPDGTATVIWNRYEDGPQVVEAKRVAFGGLPDEATRTVSEPEEQGIDEQAAVDTQGGVYIVWVGRSDGAQSIKTRYLSADGSTMSSVRSASAESAVAPKIAIGPDDAGALVWQRRDGNGFEVEERRFDPGGEFVGGPQALGPAGSDGREPRIAIDRDGVTTIAWDAYDGSDFAIKSRRIDAAGAMQPESATLSAPGGQAGSPTLAAAASALVAWRRFDGSRDVLETSTFGVPDAQLTPVSSEFEEVTLPDGPTQTKSIQVGNGGTASLAISGVELIGSGRDQFEVVDASACLSHEITARGSCLIEVRFAPDEPGYAQAALLVSSDAADSPASASLTGKASAPPPDEPGPPPPGTPAPPKSPTPVPGPLASLRVMSLRHLARGGAVVTVALSTPGTLQARGKGIQVKLAPETGPETRGKCRVLAPESVRLRVRATGSTLRSLRSKGRVRASLGVEFVPDDGAPYARDIGLTLRLAKH